jgi:hypothetical protein
VLRPREFGLAFNGPPNGFIDGVINGSFAADGLRGAGHIFVESQRGPAMVAGRQQFKAVLPGGLGRKAVPKASGRCARRRR